MRLKGFTIFKRFYKVSKRFYNFQKVLQILTEVVPLNNVL